MTERLFGTDGIRGEANVYPMTPEVALRVGRAAGYLFRKDDNPHTILIGKDTRQSGYMIETALTAGFCSMGINVRLVGPLPTPGVSYIMRSLRADAAVMISASHNPYYDNGIKFFARDGYKLPDEMEDEIERLVSGTEIDSVRPTGTRLGRARRIEDAGGRFIEYAKSTFPRGMRLDGLKIVCDAANGAAYHVGPDTLTELGAEVVALGVSPDGTNINANCGSMFPEVMRSKVITEKAHLGIAFDGDGDRVVMADEDGRLLDGNALLAILAADMIERTVLPKKTLVTTIMANGGLERALAPLGGKLVRTKVGDRYVVEAMRRDGYMLGGESSGHIILLDYNTTGDALITVLQLLATMVRHGRKLSDLARAYEAMPERHAKVPIQNGVRPSEEALDKVRKKAEAELNGQGRVVIRPSGTEPVIRVMVQHVSDRTAETLVQELADDISAL
jgi:phosphoglucosamine mutase